VIAVVAFVVGVGLAQPATGTVADRDVAELSRLEAVWNDAHLRGDAGVLDRLWADDLVVFVPKMAPLPKSGALAFLRSGRMAFRRYESSEIAVRVYGESAVVTGRLLRSRDVGGRVLEDDWRFTKVYVRQAGGWRVVAFHASETAQ
jgi:ketosteroid isomerase-like protein